MDLSHLTRPAVLCQCARCSSSLAACENDWTKLSNSYSIAAGWLSVDPSRISISSEKKQIPQSSDLTLLRGCILQEVSCRLCQQKLGAVGALENGYVHTIACIFVYRLLTSPGPICSGRCPRSHSGRSSP